MLSLGPVTLQGVRRDTAIESSGGGDGDEVRPPLPVKRETLYDDPMLYGCKKYPSMELWGLFQDLVNQLKKGQGIELLVLQVPVNKVRTYCDLRNVLMKRIFLSAMHFRIKTRYKVWQNLLNLLFPLCKLS
ncbi:hypothetical protein K1719_008789 [Acacia pycnantha]|nr:hypothetical protein K1719_008789 [Acacia pycnantha]